ncbi:hypothetical protein BGZ51_003698 [Haplosporangium sp. Z 767]|nr:hypothetical protein BGZ51_003698 [Haplosporangium sp. Z 767]KAF9184558.1 hypothetical protein BGZ50_003607 [Haplosporangium sp. Z 11]
MAFNQKRASTTSSASFAASVNPRRQSSYGHIMAGTGGLPSSHTAAIKIPLGSSGNNSNNNNNSSSTSSKRMSGLHLLNPLHSQHRNQSLKARVARACPSLIHGSPRRRRSLWIVLCTGGIIVLIYFLSAWDIKISSSVLDRSSFSFSSGASSSSSKQQQLQQRQERPQINYAEKYRNPDGSEMDQKSIFMLREFGFAQCQRVFAGAQKTLSEEIKRERELARQGEWKSISKANAYTLSLNWKRSLKQILPNWKEYNGGWVGQGVVLGAFRDGDGRDTVANTLVQIKLIRSLSPIPIEVWFERAEDVSEELHEQIITLGAVIRSLDDDASNVSDAAVEHPDSEIPPGSLVRPIRQAEIHESIARIGRNLGQLQKALTVAALINSGFEDIVYFSPSTLPMLSPRLVFQQPGYQRTGALFWEHPTSSPAHDSPIWRIIHADCITTSNEQSWSAVALRHKDSWKGLFLAWHWLTGADAAVYNNVIGTQGNDLLRLAWVAVNRQYVMVDKMPQAGLSDLSRTKGDGVACNQGATLYPAPGADILEDPKKYSQDQRQQQRLFQQSYRYGAHDEFFAPNRNVMMVDTSLDSTLIHAGSNSQDLHQAIDRALTKYKDPTRVLLTDSYAAGSGGRVCLRIKRTPRGYQSE